MKSLLLVGLLVGVAAAKTVPFLAAPSNARIINGEVVEASKVPHQVVVRAGNSLCGGSIIHQNWVLTAAHCVAGLRSRDVFIQVNADTMTSGQQYGVRSIRVHHGYSSTGSVPNDIALLEINDDLSPENVIPVATDTAGNFAGDQCTISGYGVTEKGEHGTLKEAAVTILTEDNCKNEWSGIGAYHICLKGEGDQGSTGACNGDSGGPLVCGGKLAGVTSWGAAGCHNGGTVEKPSVYARVSHFYEWINEECNCNLN